MRIDSHSTTTIRVTPRAKKSVAQPVDPQHITLPPPKKNLLNNSELRSGSRHIVASARNVPARGVSARTVSGCSVSPLQFLADRVAGAVPDASRPVTPEMPAGLPPGRQVYSLIHTWLLSGEYGPGDLLPTARDIAHFCNDISNSTVRRVLKILINEGLLRGVPGKGVYVGQVKNGSHHDARSGAATVS